MPDRSEGRPIVAVHGFGGSARSYDDVARALGPDAGRLVPVELRGHGARRGHRPVTLEAVLGDLRADLAAAGDGPVVLAGYSMGGRVALQLALAEPERIGALVLIAATAGLEDPAERAERRRVDERRAAELEAHGAAAFAESWVRLPLWQGDPPAATARQRAELAAGDAAGLAAALRGLGPGAVPAVWDRLAALRAPLTVVVGARDARYRALGRRLLAAAAQPAGEVVVAGAGHGLLRESPGAVAAALRAL